MARSPRFTPAAMLEHARAAVAEDRDVTVKQFRDAQGVGMADAGAALAAAKWEVRHRQFGALRREDLDPRFRDLVRSLDDGTKVLDDDLHSIADHLAAPFERAFADLRGTVEGLLAAMAGTAQRQIDAERDAAREQVLHAAGHELQLAGAVEVAERQAAEAREEVERIRRSLGEQVASLSQRLSAEETRRRLSDQRAAIAEEERQSALRELDRSRLGVAELRAKVDAVVRAHAAAENGLASLEARVQDLTARLTEATAEARVCREEATTAKMDAAEAKGRLAAAREIQETELERLRAQLREVDDDVRRE